MNTRTLRAAAACALLTTTCLVAPAYGQAVPSAYPNVDANGVDLTDGSYNFSLVEGSIGSGEGALSLVRYGIGGTSLDNWSGLYLYEDSSVMTVALGDRSESFTKLASGGFTARQGNGATLTGGDRNYVYRGADGTTIAFGPPVTGDEDLARFEGCNTGNFANCRLPALTVTEPSGKTTTLTYDVHSDFQRSTNQPGGFDEPSTIGDNPGEPTISGNTRFFWRLNGVSNSFGYAMSVAYQPGGLVNNQASPDWFKRASVTFSNTALGGPTPTATYTNPESNILEITDTGGRVWRITSDGGRIKRIKRPGAATDSTIIDYGPDGVSQVTRDGITTRYSRKVSGSAATTVVTDAANVSSSVTSNTSTGRPTQITDAAGRSTLFEYDGNGRATRVVGPGGQEQRTAYDARGNVTQSTMIAAPVEGQATPAAMITTADYAATCAAVLTCNQPTATRDAGGNQTDYVYDDATGNVLSVTAPAPVPGGVRPQTRYSYARVAGVSLPTEMSVCRTTASCVGTADEVRTTVRYDTPNGQVSSVSTGAGDGSLTATTAVTYDAIGNVVTVDGPLPGPADTSRAYYNASREVVGTIGPDPDGAGPLRRRAQDMLRNADGQVVRVLGGTANGIGDADLAGMSAVNATRSGYDVDGRKVFETFDSEGIAVRLTRSTYDALGRPLCTAERMNPAGGFVNSTVDACALTLEGTAGPDRITRMVYDPVGRPFQQRVAVGTADEAAEVTATYDPAGRMDTLTDGEGNLTRYTYDGFGRVVRTSYPAKDGPKGAASATDYEGLTYDDRGNVVSRRLRDGSVIGLGYDALGRLVSKDVPNTVYFDHDLTYAYDNLGRMVRAGNPAGLMLEFGYDALGRKVREGSNWYGYTTSAYDLGGRRTRLTWRDGFFVTYDHLVTGEMKTIRENGGPMLIGFDYDNLGRRTRLIRANRTQTHYAYDPGYRVQSLIQDFAGTAKDLTLGFAYNAASQITDTSRSNPVYDWAGTPVADITSTVNGLNQLVQVGGTGIVHDARGNLTSDGTRTYGYTTENRLMQGPDGTLLAYDAVGRLIHVSNGSTDLMYDGADLIEESDAYSGAIRRRHVHGPGSDEPLLTYDNGMRRYLHADERGSIVATSDDAAEAGGVNTYDEYGMPAATNTGRFQYTGQAWLPELGLYNYKARMYDPRLGRFLQSDPIGYWGGMNGNYVLE